MQTVISKANPTSGSQDYLPKSPQTPPECIYISTINPCRNKTFVGKLLRENQTNTNATIVPLISFAQDDQKSIPIAIFANAHWKGSSSFVFSGGASGAIFYGGFPADINSDRLFYTNYRYNQLLKKNSVSDDMVTELNQMGLKLKLYKAQGKNVYRDFWGNITEASMLEKIIEIGERKQVAVALGKPLFSSTEYYKRLSGPMPEPEPTVLEPIVSYNHGNPVEIEQTHNECHIKATLFHVKSITITQQDFSERDVGIIEEFPGKKILNNNKHVARLIAKKMQQQISEARKKISEVKDDESRQELEYCVDVEISKSTVILQKFALLHEKIKYHQENTTIENNKMMKIAFANKKKKDSKFIENEKNQKIWIESQINYLQGELDNLHNEIKDLKALYGFEITATESLESVIQKMTQIIQPTKTSTEIKEDFKKEIDDWKEKVQTNEVLRQSIKDKITLELKKDIPITIYDKSKPSITMAPDFEVSIDNDFKKDPLIIYQLVTGNLSEKINELYPNEKEREVAIVECNKLAIKKGLESLALKSSIFNKDEILKILLSSLQILPSSSQNLKRMKAQNFKKMTEMGGGLILIDQSRKGNIEIVKILLDKDADPVTRDQNGNTSLMWASFHGHVEIVEILLHKSPTPNIKSNNKQTALMWASYNGHVEIVKKLLDSRAFAFEQDSDGNTALIWASVQGHAKIVEILLGKFGGPNIKNINGQTALILASHYGHVGIVEILLNEDADLNCKDCKGNTALMMASGMGHVEMAKVLLENGADTDIRNEDGKMVTEIIKNPEIKKLLETYQGASKIFSESSDIQTLIKDINSFKKEDLMEVKSFSFQDKEIKLNALGIINLYKSCKPDLMYMDVDIKSGSLEEAINSLHKKIKNTHEDPPNEVRVSSSAGILRQNKRSAEGAELEGAGGPGRG
jgi:ankyrin repeat protein